MLSGHYFRRLSHRVSSGAARARHAPGGLRALITHQIVERLARIGQSKLNAVAVDLTELVNSDDLPASPGHPACACHAGSDYCRESWQLHLAELQHQPESHWHLCDHRMRCAIVPIVHRGRCLAAVKIACAASVSEARFARQVELLDLLAREFAVANADYLERLSRIHPASTQPLGEPVERGPAHKQILKAMHYIEDHLSDPKLTVSRVAGELGTDPSYLSHLFVAQVGQRMSRFIAARRIELAKHLLATTDWQIKRIAHETGHANTNWFCYSFRAMMSLTPGAYRKRAHHHSPAAPRR